MGHRKPNSYDVGDPVVIELTVQAGSPLALTAPSEVVLKIIKPDGTLHSELALSDDDIVEDEAGKYHYDFIVPSAGTWRYRWETSGTVIGAEQDRFVVRPSYAPAP